MTFIITIDTFCDEDGTREFSKSYVCPACEYSAFMLLGRYIYETGIIDVITYYKLISLYSADVIVYQGTANHCVSV